MSMAFEGIRIIDFTQVLAGPFGVMQLALLGAEVIKVEQPGTGDQTRGLMNAGEDIGMSPSFMGMNLNKKSITLNLKSPDAVEIIKKLVVAADVVVENFKAGTMPRAERFVAAINTISISWRRCGVNSNFLFNSRFKRLYLVLLL